jgi:hypothetical protein
MSELWRIDALDGRAGRAFASLRPADLLSSLPELNQSCVFVAAPYFQPEAVSSRATALAATRGSFQLGIFDGAGGEVGFPSLEALLEFVRRVYLRAGGGDPGAGPAPGVPPRPEGPEPPRPEGGPARETGDVGAYGEDLTGPIIRNISQFNLTSSKLRYDRDEGMEVQNFSATFSTNVQSIGKSNLLAKGAYEMLRELLNRFPISGAKDQTLNWRACAVRLGRAIHDLDLWPQLLAEFPIDALGRRPSGRKTVLDLNENWYNRIDHMSKVLYELERSGNYNLLALLGGLKYPFPRGWLFEQFYCTRDEVTDPVDDLASWPINEDLEYLVHAQKDYRRSMFDLLNASLGSPNSFTKDPKTQGERAIALIIFAAAHLTKGGESRLGGDEASIELITLRALKWIADQFPRVIYPTVIEEIIASASNTINAYR